MCVCVISIGLLQSVSQDLQSLMLSFSLIAKWHTWDGAFAVHPGNQAAGTGAVIRRTAHLGWCTRQAPGLLSSSDQGRAQDAGPTESVPLWSIQEPEPEQLRPGTCTQLRAHFVQFPFRATWSLSIVDQESTGALRGGKTQCGPYRANTLHTHHWYLFSVSLPPQTTTNQVSLNKWPTLLPCVRVEIRHLRDLQTRKPK